MKIVREMLVAVLLSTAAVAVFAPPAGAQVVVMVGSPPPLLPVYDQPPLPDIGYIWVPGYWAYDDAGGYFWVPGTWILPPRPGLLWTPGYWAFESGSYGFHPGYWGDRVGYYGGVDYGFGYTGVGYQGGYWRGNQFFYNRAVTRITNVQVVNVYNETIVREPGAGRVSFNGGPGGIRLRPTPEQVALMHERHVPPTGRQIEHVRDARQDPQLRERENHGRPPQAATPRATDFNRGPGAEPQRAPGAVPPPGREPGAERPRDREPGVERPRDREPGAERPRDREPGAEHPRDRGPGAEPRPRAEPPRDHEPRAELRPRAEPRRDRGPGPRGEPHPRAEPHPHPEPRDDRH